MSFLSGRTLILTEAGFAANHCSSLVKGFTPLRLGLAATLTEQIALWKGVIEAAGVYAD